MSAGRFHILVVEDNEADVYLLRKAFEHAGLDTDLTVIDDGAEALAYVRGDGQHRYARRPHVALLDLNLPKNEGTDVLEALRANANLSSIPVIVLTSSASPADRLRLEHLRVDRFVTKPPDLEEFLKIGNLVSDLLLNAKSSRGIMNRATS